MTEEDQRAFEELKVMLAEAIDRARLASQRLGIILGVLTGEKREPN